MAEHLQAAQGQYPKLTPWCSEITFQFFPSCCLVLTVSHVSDSLPSSIAGSEQHFTQDTLYTKCLHYIWPESPQLWLRRDSDHWFDSFSIWWSVPRQDTEPLVKAPTSVKVSTIENPNPMKWIQTCDKRCIPLIWNGKMCYFIKVHAIHCISFVILNMHYILM